MSIKLWDWEKDFQCIQTFEGHVHYVMMIRVNPRDTNTFASASLDRSIKVWGLTASTPHFSLEGTGAHEKGVNCIDYYPGGDKPYILSGADDRTVKIWDYQTKACLQTLEGHSHNISSVCFHPRLPLIISASEDGTVRLWHSTTYRPESTLNYGLERAWCLAPTKDASKLAVGYDEGTVVLKLGNERPVASLDANTSKLIWAQGHDIQTMTVKGLAKENDLQDGEKISLPARDLGSCEVYPQSLQHNSNGSFIVVCGDGEYIIYTSQALRNKAFGSALDFVWSSLGTGDFAIRESISRVRTFKNFKDHKQITLPMAIADGIFGGNCLSVKGSDSIVFFDWETGEFIRKIDVSPDQVYWNDAGDMVVLVCSDMYYILRYARDVVVASISAGSINPEEGVEGSFELENTVNDRVRTGQWVGDCFLYTNGSGKLNYYVGGEVMTLCHLNYPMYLLGFVPKEDRVFLIDKAYNVVSYKLLVSVLNYQTAVVRKDFEAANSILPSIPRSELNAVARFLESQGFKEEALNVTTDPDHKFELAIDLRKMDIAHSVLLEESSKLGDEDSTEMNNRWRRLGDLALANGDLDLAQYCAKLSGDLSGLLLLYSAASDKEGMKSLAAQARTVGRSNVAFLAYFVTGQVEDCVDVLIETGRIPEAAFFARTYMPSLIPR
jgi:coatomer subunit beta'